MCDYSLRHAASRSAKVGDRLVTTAFGSPMNRGFAAVNEPAVAVCLLPGTELAMERVPEYEHILGRLFPSLRSRKTRGHKVARFRQLNPDAIAVHHDALEFPNGKTVLVADLVLGQEMTVLQLPPQARRAAEHAEPMASKSEPGLPGRRYTEVDAL
jgi:hypothetical protein